MGDGWPMLLVIGVTLVTTLSAIVVHYEGMVLLGKHYARRPRDNPSRGADRRTVLKVVAGLFVLHVTEIWLFGLGYWGLLQLPGTGSIAGAHPLGLFDSIYLSAVTFTTVGFGDVAPVGAVRLLAGTEALLGLMLITWSASFTFVEMARHWQDDDGS